MRTMKTKICILLLSAISSIALGQDRCSSDQALAHLLTHQPEQAQAIALAEKQALEAPKDKARDVVTIPVVVHVVYNTSQQNISDAQILSQIEILNEDFRLLNADKDQVPDAFKNLRADTEIEFCLASRDELGLPTTGIVRVQTPVTEWNINTNADDVKDSSEGGSDGWNRDSYLNIWVCNLSSGILGYAYPPGISANLDGVVIGYKYFGDEGTVSFPFNKGRTTTHEVGHWLGLSHVWGSNGGCTSDNIDDTPLQDGPNYGCPSFPNLSSCSGQDNGPDGDMFMNYMDYVDDRCMMMFSLDQKARMEGVLNSTRIALRTSLGCGAFSLEEKETTQVQVFPNPSQGIIQIQGLTEGEHYQLSLYDLQGKLQANDYLAPGENTWEAPQLPAGVYSLILSNNNEQLNTKLVIY